MNPLDNITDFAQDVNLAITGSESNVTGDDLARFQRNCIRFFNLWLDEYETETYWNKLRENDFVLATIADTTTFSFELPEEYRTPVFNQDKCIKFINDGTVISYFELVDPNQRINDENRHLPRPDRATFVGSNIVLSRAPKPEELGAEIVLDVVRYHPRLSTTDDEGLDLLPARQLAVLGVAKNMALAKIIKVSLSPTFTEKYSNLLARLIADNNKTNALYDMQGTDFGYIDGIW